MARNESEMTKSQRKRAAYDYREAYFRKNPGVCGCIWFCAYCGIPIFGKSGVQVDHIVPLAGIGINRTFNTVAACPRCNHKKSDKGGLWCVRGGVAKIFEVALFTTQKIVLHLAVAIVRVLHTGIRLAITAITSPARNGNALGTLFILFGLLIILLLIL